MIPLAACQEVAVCTFTEIGIVVILNPFGAIQYNELRDMEGDLPDMDFAFSVASGRYI